MLEKSVQKYTTKTDTCYKYMLESDFINILWIFCQRNARRVVIQHEKHIALLYNVNFNNLWHQHLKLNDLPKWVGCLIEFCTFSSISQILLYFKVVPGQSWSYHLEIIRFYCMHICAHMMVLTFTIHAGICIFISVHIISNTSKSVLWHC